MVAVQGKVLPDGEVGPFSMDFNGIKFMRIIKCGVTEMHQEGNDN